MKRVFLLTLTILGLLVLNGICIADNQPRDYIAAPPGTFLSLIYYNHSSADAVYSDGRTVADNVDYSGNFGTARFVYYFNLGPIVAAQNLLIPFGDQKLRIPNPGQANNTYAVDLSTSGVADPFILTNFWLYNNKENMTWIAFSPYFFFPIGNYDNDGALSMGSHRWRFKEEINFTKGFTVIPGHNAYIELTLAGDFFTNNDRTGAAHLTSRMDPVLTVESHLSYDVTSSLFASADYYYHNGGETSIAGISQHDSLSTHTIGFSLGYNITPNYQVLLQYTNNFEVENGLNTQGILFRFMYATELCCGK